MSKRQVYGFSFGVVIIILSFFLVVGLSGKRYFAETLAMNDTKIQEDIDTQIREAQGPLFIRRLFLNKPMYMVNKFRENYIRAYSPEFLFLYTEPSGIYSIWSRGRIYTLDGILIILGIAYLYSINKKAAVFMTLIVLTAGLPGMIGGFPYSARNFFLSAFLPVLAAAGALFLLGNSFAKRIKPLIIILLVVVYSYLLGSYLFDYYGRYSLYGGEAWAKSLRDVSILVDEKRGEYKRVIVGTASLVDFLQYAFYSKVPPADVQDAWRQRQPGEKGPSFTIGNVTFTPDCISDKNNSPVYGGEKPLLYVVHGECHPIATPSAQITDYPGNTVWKIYRIYGQ